MMGSPVRVTGEKEMVQCHLLFFSITGWIILGLPFEAEDKARFGMADGERLGLGLRWGQLSIFWSDK